MEPTQLNSECKDSTACCSHGEVRAVQMPHVTHCFPALSVLLKVMIASMFWQDNTSRGVDYSAMREVLTSSPLTWYPWDGDLLAAAAIPPLSKWLYLDDIILISGQSQLHGGAVGFHDIGMTVSILFVEHLMTQVKPSRVSNRHNFLKTARDRVLTL